MNKKKITRELYRIFMQCARLPRNAANFLFGRWYYDLLLRKNVEIVNGQKSPKKKAVIFLIFPQHGLLKSHIRTLRYLVNKNRSVTVVSNAQVNASDREVLLEYCERLIIRPNYGYDFGGYRDGILCLGQRLHGLEQLVLLNDSVWFPITDASDWLQEVDQLNVDMAGAVSNYGTSQHPAERFRDVKFDYTSNRKGFHYCSFALAFGAKVLQDPRFEMFWQRFRLSNDKKKTVRRGELGLSAFIIEQGYSHASTFDVTGLRERLESHNRERLLKVSANLIIPDDRRFTAVSKSLKPGLCEMSKADLVSLILTAVTRQGAGYVLPEYTVVGEKFPFLKKSPVWMEQESSRISVSILERLGSPASLEALEEASTLLRRERRRASKF